MAQVAMDVRRHAHELIDRMGAGQVSAVVGLLEVMLDPVSRAIADAPLDDEPETQGERDAVATSKAWLQQHPRESISHADVLAEFGLSSADFDR